MKMDGGTPAVQAVCQNNLFQTPHYLQQICNGTSRPDYQTTGFVPDYPQSVLSHYLSKEEFSRLAGSALPFEASSENAQYMHQGKSYPYDALYNFPNASCANIRPPGFQQHPSTASGTSPSNQDYSSTSSKAAQWECLQRQFYSTVPHNERANNALHHPLPAHQRFQQITNNTMQTQTNLVTRQCVTNNGLGQNTYICHQAPTFPAAQMTLDSNNQGLPQMACRLSNQPSGPPGVHQKEGAPLPKTIEGKKPLLPPIPNEVKRALHLQSKYMKLGAKTNTLRLHSGTQNRVHMIPNQPPNNISSPKESSVPYPRTASIDFKYGETCISLPKEPSLPSSRTAHITFQDCESYVSSLKEPLLPSSRTAPITFQDCESYVSSPKEPSLTSSRTAPITFKDCESYVSSPKEPSLPSSRTAPITFKDCESYVSSPKEPSLPSSRTAPITFQDCESYFSSPKEPSIPSSRTAHITFQDCESYVSSPKESSIPSSRTAHITFKDCESYVSSPKELSLPSSRTTPITFKDCESYVSSPKEPSLPSSRTAHITFQDCESYVSSPKEPSIPFSRTAPITFKDCDSYVSSPKEPSLPSSRTAHITFKDCESYISSPKEPSLPSSRTAPITFQDSESYVSSPKEPSLPSSRTAHITFQDCESYVSSPKEPSLPSSRTAPITFKDCESYVSSPKEPSLPSSRTAPITFKDFESYVSSPKEPSLPSSKTVPINFNDSESYASTLVQITKLQRILQDGHAFITSKSSATVDQNTSSAGRIQVQAKHSANGLNNITDIARAAVDLPLNPKDLTTVQENSQVTGEDLIKLHKEMISMKERFVHLLRNYKQMSLEFRSANNDKIPPASLAHDSNIFKICEKVPDANKRAVLPDNGLNLLSPPANFSSHSANQQFSIMLMNSFQDNQINQNVHVGMNNQNSSKASHLNYTPLDSRHESNQLDKTLQVVGDCSTTNASISLFSTLKEKQNQINQNVHIGMNNQNSSKANHLNHTPLVSGHESNQLDKTLQVVGDCSTMSASISLSGTFEEKQNQINQNVHIGMNNQNSNKASHLNHQPLGSGHESNQLGKALQVLGDCSTMSASISLSSTLKEKQNLHNSQRETCQQLKQKHNLFVSNATNFAHNCLSHANKDITSQSNAETASTSPSQLKNLCVSPSGLSTSVAVPEPQKKTSHLQKHVNNQKLNDMGKEISVTDSPPKKATQRCKKASGLSFSPMTAETAMRQLKDLLLLDDRWKKKPCKVNESNSQVCPNVYPRPVSSSEKFHKKNCTVDMKTSQNAVHMSSSNETRLCTKATVVLPEPELLTLSATQPVEPSSVVANPLTNHEIQSSKQGNIPQTEKNAKDVRETFPGQLPKLNEKDMSLSHYRVAINSLLDKLDSYSTITSVDAEEMVSLDDSSEYGKVIQIKTEPNESQTESTKVDNPESGNVMHIKTEPCKSEPENTKDVSSESGNIVQIKTEPCKSETENTKVNHSESENIMQMKTDTCESVNNTKSLDLETCVLSEPQSDCSCQTENSQFQARDVPLLLAEEVPEPPIKIEIVCSLVEGNTFYNSHVAHVFGTNDVQESNDLDALSNNIVIPESKVQAAILPNSQFFGDSKVSSDLPLKNYPHPAEISKREGDFSISKEKHDKQLSLAAAQPLEEILCGKDDASEPCLYSQLSELLKAFPFGIEQTESAPLRTINEGTEKKGRHNCQSAKKQKGQNVQKSNISPQKTFPAQRLIMNKSSSVALDKHGSTEIQYELQGQIDNKHSSVDKCDYKKSATVGRIHVTVVDSEKLIINVIESPTEPEAETSLKKNQDVSGFHSAMTNIVIEANEKSLGDPCGKQENVLLDGDEVVWVKTETSPHVQSSTACTPNVHSDDGLLESLEKDVSLVGIDPEISEKYNCKDRPWSNTPEHCERLVGFNKRKKEASEFIVRTDFLKSKYSRSMVPVKSNKIKLLNRKNTEQDIVKKRCKTDKIKVRNLSDLTGSGIENKPATEDKGLSTAEERLLIENVCTGKPHKDTEAMSNAESNSTAGKDHTHAQAIEEYFQCWRKGSLSAEKKIPTGNKEDKYHNTRPLIPHQKPTVDLAKLKRIVMRASENDLRENVSKHMQSLVMTENNMPPTTTSKVLSTTLGDLKLCVKSPVNDSTSEHTGGHHCGKEIPRTSATKSTEHIGTDFLKRVGYLDVSNGILQLSPFDFPLPKESHRKRRQGSFAPPLTKEPETPILQCVPGEPKMLEFKLCPGFLMGGHLAAADDSTVVIHHSGVEDGSQTGICSQTNNCTNIPFKKRKVNMAKFHGKLVVLSESPGVGQMMPTAEKTNPTATSSSQDLYNTCKKMYLEKQNNRLV